MHLHFQTQYYYNTCIFVKTYLSKLGGHGSHRIPDDITNLISQLVMNGHFPVPIVHVVIQSQVQQLYRDM